MNLFASGRVHVLVDYAHNPPALRQLAGFVQGWQGERIVVVGMPGDRRDEDYRAIGEICARTFDRIILRGDSKVRQRPPAEVVAEIVAGIRQASTACTHEVVTDEPAGVDRAFAVAADGALIVLLADHVDALLADPRVRGGT
jgi:cyanophycin synthetase